MAAAPATGQLGGSIPTPGSAPPATEAAGTSGRRAPADPGAPGGGPDWPRWFLIVGTIIGLIYVATMPVSRPLDEPHHIRRTATLVRGVVVPPSFGATDADYRVDGCVEALVVQAGRDFRSTSRDDAQTLSRSDRWRNQITNPPCGEDRQLVGGGSISGAEVNSPVPYLPAMVGYAAGRPIGGALGAVYGARLVQLAVYLGVCWWALRRLPWGRPFAAAVALVPTSLAGAAGVSADPVTFALALAVIAAVLDLVAKAETRPPRVAGTRHLVLVAAGFVLLSLCKPAVAPLVLLVVVVPTAAFGTLRRRVGWIVATIATVAVSGGAWALGVASKVHVTTTPGVDSSETAAWLNAHLWTLPGTLWRTLSIPDASRYLLGGTVMPLGLDVLEVPVIVTLAGIGVLVAARLVDPLPARFARGGARTGRARPRSAVRQLTLERVTAVVIVLAGTAAVTYGIYVAANPPDSSVISGIQGRYFLPYVLLLLVGTRPGRRRRARRGLHVAVLAGLVGLHAWWLVTLYRWWGLV